MSASASQVAKHFDRDVSVVLKWPAQGCPVVRRGSRGPGNGTLFDLAAVEAWRRKANPVGPTPEEAVQKIATALLATLTEDRADIAADVTKAQCAVVLKKAFERCSESFGVKFKFDELPKAICALHAYILSSVERGEFQRRKTHNGL